tara:strand:+ start:129 stop:1400 length:1272 start_codon:yes stop_codon:yes gene_type:complete
MALTQISTGMLASGDGTVDLNIDNGTFVVDVSTSRVGIGNSSPSVKLDVTGAISATGNIKTTGDVEIASAQPRLLLNRGDGAYTWNIYNGGGTDFPESSFNIANNSGTAVITALDNGNVVVGGTSLNAASSVGFTAGGQIRQVFASGVANDSLFGAISGVSNGFQIIQDTSNNQSYKFHNGGTPSLTIDSSGNVLVGGGIVSASGLLSVAVGNTTGGALVAQDTNGAKMEMQAAGGLGYLGTTSNHPALFLTNNTERMRIDSSGNVGIGTSAPVNNTNRTTLGLQGAWGGQLDIMVGSTVHAQFGTDNFSSGQSCRIQSQDSIVFKAGGSTERMRIDSSGGITGTCINAATGEYVGSLDDLKKTGFYRSRNTNTNNPTSQYHSVVVFGNQGNVTSQIAVTLATTTTYVRSFNNSWTAWARLDT